MAADQMGVKPVVDGNDWLVWNYTHEQWIAYANSELRRALWKSRLELIGGWLLAGIFGYMSLAVIPSKPLEGIGVLLVIALPLAFIFTSSYRDEIKEARAVHQRRMQATTGTIRIAARRMRDPGAVTDFVCNKWKPVAVRVEGTPARLFIKLREYGRSPAVIRLHIPIPPGHEAEAAAFARRFWDEVISAYWGHNSYDPPPTLIWRGPTQQHTAQLNPAPPPKPAPPSPGADAAHRTRRLPADPLARRTVSARPRRQHGKPPGDRLPDHPTQHLPPDN